MNIETKKPKFWLNKLKKRGFKDIKIEEHDTDCGVYIVRY